MSRSELIGIVRTNQPGALAARSQQLTWRVGPEVTHPVTRDRVA
jgi:hypothetical protein